MVDFQVCFNGARYRSDLVLILAIDVLVRGLMDVVECLNVYLVFRVLSWIIFFLTSLGYMFSRS